MYNTLIVIKDNRQPDGNPADGVTRQPVRTCPTVVYTCILSHGRRKVKLYRTTIVVHRALYFDGTALYFYMKPKIKCEREDNFGGKSKQAACM